MHSSLTDFSCTPVLMLDRRSLRASEMGGGAGCSLVVVGFEESAESGGGGANPTKGHQRGRGIIIC